MQPPVRLSVPLSETPSATSASTGSVNNSRVTNILELLIDRNGNVESARLVPRSERLGDMWLPQAAKNMKFKPAMKNNVPVKYLLQMPWTSSPG